MPDLATLESQRQAIKADYEQQVARVGQARQAALEITAEDDWHTDQPL